jgi:hypothetical protein
MSGCCTKRIVAREGNVLRVDFTPEPKPPAPAFPGTRAARETPECESEADLTAPPLWLAPHSSAPSAAARGVVRCRLRIQDPFAQEQNRVGGHRSTARSQCGCSLHQASRAGPAPAYRCRLDVGAARCAVEEAPALHLGLGFPARLRRRARGLRRRLGGRIGTRVHMW